MAGVAGRRAVVSGGSRGIGLALAKQLARDGASVAIVARSPDALEAARAEIAAQAAPGVAVAAFAVDVTDDASVAALPAQVEAAIGVCDLLICNQGYARCAPIQEASVDSFRALLDTNLLGHVRLVKAFEPGMRALGQGDVCLVTSMLGFMSFYGYGAYSASKFGIVGFAEALRQEMLPHGVRVGVFYPPTTDTPGLAEENETKPALTWAIEGTSRKFTAEQVAGAILAGIARGRFVSMIGVDSWAVYYLSRWVPWLVRWVIDRELHKHQRSQTPA